MVPTLQRGNPVRDALRPCDAERRQLRAHAERGYDQACRLTMVPTLQRGNPMQDALRPCDAERRQLRAHAERGYEQNPWWLSVA